MIEFLARVTDEVLRAKRIHAPIHSCHEGYAVILEELEEAKAEIFTKEIDYEKLLKELVQTAAMCARLAEDVVLPKLREMEQ